MDRSFYAFNPLFWQQAELHFIRHAVDVIISEKNVNNAPVIIAPITLVAAKLIARSTNDVRIVPSIPVSK